MHAVASLIGGPGCGILALIFKRLAQGKRDVDPVIFGGTGSVKLFAHHRGGFGREPIRLEVGEAPPRIPEIRAVDRRSQIGFNRLASQPFRLERMTEPKVEIGAAYLRINRIPWNFGHHFAVFGDHFRETAQADADRRGLRTMGVVPRIARQQWFQRFTSLRKFVARNQHLHIFMTRLVMVRHHRQNTRIERLGIVEHVPQMTNLCQQAHCFGMVAGLYKKAAD